MCQLFVGADPALWENDTRSLRLEGMATSVRLEAFFWSVLEDIGVRDQLSVSQLLQRLYRESLDEGHDLDNFASFLRVCCGRYLALQLSGEVPTDARIALRDVDAAGILARETGRRGAAVHRHRPAGLPAQ
ncbi:MAG: ribbon-helix-helix domain-containing protein [Hoeflea sp.]|uniref:ribbon-helix-helix domain-containing protein n=1 Tax=Hoeflea sp. TaxID=1940281 RepID=UPI001D73275A|nr:ribbon-helix-helix domain-containing protein [Hoeflea sp.]MBU4530420.1 ribbon-helix-helix domain-containing protein [Alphaproteobacteria bacterium]MBU4545207.1 ribbon-helix-helix domain-containing protein [Alphaproteobacteria bacterium]MBU4549593.1 ribbon-helix-helix domain-containing protein [Alphaproteobacteria bacterium]MBV1722010.1 ribbon-helix-helix domain-containing protein [Hoeflea sp.]MBV1761360.1 ribbon-helix-helix domain-containing protein [Hoeflea sp.]